MSGREHRAAHGLLPGSGSTGSPNGPLEVILRPQRAAARTSRSEESSEVAPNIQPPSTISRSKSSISPFSEVTLSAKALISPRSIPVTSLKRLIDDFEQEIMEDGWMSGATSEDPS